MTTEEWLAACREVAADVARAAAALPTREVREPVVGQGRGGDDTTAVDAAAEAAAVGRLERLHREAGAPFRLVSEELGERAFGDGGGPVVVLDPIDGSLNAKRLLPFHCVSVAVADGPALSRVRAGYVLALAGGAEWAATDGGGAWQGGERLRVAPAGDGGLGVVALEATTAAGVATAAARLDGHVERLRILGALAQSLCELAAGRLDGVVSLKPVRPVDVAAGALMVREAGGAALLPDSADLPLTADARSRIVAARDEETARRLAALVYGPG